MTRLELSEGDEGQDLIKTVLQGGGALVPDQTWPLSPLLASHISPWPLP